MINMFGSRPNLCYDAVVETLSTINNTSLPKSPSEYVQYPLSRMQQNKCMFVNQLMAEAMMCNWSLGRQKAVKLLVSMNSREPK